MNRTIPLILAVALYIKQIVRRICRDVPSKHARFIRLVHKSRHPNARLQGEVAQKLTPCPPSQRGVTRSVTRDGNDRIDTQTPHTDPLPFAFILRISLTATTH
ncbi:hypothetical protein NKH73_30705 [Mesorhizobium sp. M0938]|uniref:hypothetical protein n=1 Tax=unclassified Mesorhizobium TaxID=325217 RepID=UPI00333C169C